MAPHIDFDGLPGQLPYRGPTPRQLKPIGRFYPRSRLGWEVDIHRRRAPETKRNNQNLAYAIWRLYELLFRHKFSAK